MPRSVLIVEDNEDERLIYASVLEHQGYEVLLAADARAGVEIAAAARPGLILMDIMLPTMSGLTATEVLKAMRATRTIPVVAMSHFDLDMDSPVLAGCEAFEPKPIPSKRLVELVERLLGPAEEEADGSEDAGGGGRTVTM